MHDDLHHFAQISAEDLDLKNPHGQSSCLDTDYNQALNCAAFCRLQCSQRRSCSTEETGRNVQQLAAQLCPGFLSLFARSLTTITAKKKKSQAMLLLKSHTDGAWLS